ncbi:hypothetical protein NPIL_89161 [Nephila pilipes]|uniref:Uncharacterized protein n=1 Tax=Nephila pilipes TaxID=299642 RepID=A0A8X6QT11_NEPPI|nr:hypothetical protein NPIL_89161 [Nephila pilipes]
MCFVAYDFARRFSSKVWLCLRQQRRFALSKRLLRSFCVRRRTLCAPASRRTAFWLCRAVCVAWYSGKFATAGNGVSQPAKCVGWHTAAGKGGCYGMK